MNYKPLDTTFKKSGFRFRQLIREGDLAIFHKVHLENSLCPKETDAGFEVVVIQKNDEHIMGGVTIEAKESLPGNEKWGSKGWTYKNLLEAEKRFERLKNGDIPEDSIEISPDFEEEPVLDTSTQQEEPATKTIPQWPKSLKREELKFPEGRFTKKEFAELNGIPYSTAHPAIENMLDQEVEFVGKRKKEGRGKQSAEYQKKA